MVLTREEKEEIHMSLSVRCAFIETGTIRRAREMERAGMKDRIKVLSLDQMKTIILLEELMAKILNDL